MVVAAVVSLGVTSSRSGPRRGACRIYAPQRGMAWRGSPRKRQRRRQALRAWCPFLLIYAGS